MKVYTSPEIINTNPDLFLAGGISNCPLWQDEIIGLLEDLDITVTNPRRNELITLEGEIARVQISWEFEALELSGAILFWFPKETLCPITLLELGKMMMKDKPLFVGVHPEYKRAFDVEFQLSLERPEVKVVNSIHELVQQVKKHYRKINTSFKGER